MENSLDMIFGKWHSEEVPKLIGMLAAAQIPYEIQDHLGGQTHMDSEQGRLLRRR